jgi:hypothetical protein
VAAYISYKNMATQAGQVPVDYMTYLSQTTQAKNKANVIVNVPVTTMTLANALVSQESGGSYTTVNKDSGALGKYQIMPMHLTEIGLSNDAAGRQKFLNSPDLQDKLYNQIITGLQAKYGDNTDKILAAYYGGDGAAAIVGTPAADAPQGNYPSINDYVNQVKAKMNANQTAPGTVGSPDINTSAPGYTTKVVDGTGGLTQASLDQAALSYALTGQMPSIGIGSTGAAAQKKNAIMARAAEMDAGGNIQANKSKLKTLTESLGVQQKYLDTMQRSIGTVDDNLKLLEAAAGKVNSSNSPLINEWTNRAKSGVIGSGDLASYKAAIQTVRSEYSNILARGQGQTDATRAEAAVLIPDNITKEQLNQVIATLKAEGQNVVNNAQKQVNDIQGDMSNILSGGKRTVAQATIEDENQAKQDVIDYGKQNAGDQSLITDLVTKDDPTLLRPMTYSEVKQYLQATGKIK